MEVIYVTQAPLYFTWRISIHDQRGNNRESCFYFDYVRYPEDLYDAAVKK